MTKPSPAGSVSTGDPVTLRDLYWTFFRTALRGFGGTLPWAHRMLVEERRWLTAREFTDLLGLCQFLPGPNVGNITIVVGARFQGARGAVVAFLGLLTMPVGIMLALGALYSRFGQAPGIDGLLRGAAAAAAGLVLAMGIRMAAPLVRRPRTLLFLAAAFVAIALLRWPLIPVLLGLAPISVAAAWMRRA